MKADDAKAAKEMRALPQKERDALISAAGDKVLDARERFLHRMRQVALARAYRKPRGGGVA